MIGAVAVISDGEFKDSGAVGVFDRRERERLELGESELITGF